MPEYRDIQEQLRNFITKEFFAEGESFRDDTSLFRSGTIASLGLVEILAYIQRSFNIIVEPSEVVIDNFDTLEKMLVFIKNKHKG